MCGVPIFSLTWKPLQNTKLLSQALPDPHEFPPATCWADGGGGWLRISWESEHGMVSSRDIPHPCVSPGKGWSFFTRKHSKDLCRAITLKLQLIKNLKYWRLYYVVVVVFHFCDPHESFTNHCVFHIFSGLFLAISLWDNPFLAGHNSQRGKSHSSLFQTTWMFCLTLVPHFFDTPSTSGKNKFKKSSLWFFLNLTVITFADHSACGEQMRLWIQQNVLNIQLLI